MVWGTNPRALAKALWGDFPENRLFRLYFAQMKKRLYPTVDGSELRRSPVDTEEIRRSPVDMEEIRRSPVDWGVVGLHNFPTAVLFIQTLDHWGLSWSLTCPLCRHFMICCSAPKQNYITHPNARVQSRVWVPSI